LISTGRLAKSVDSLNSFLAQ